MYHFIINPKASSGKSIKIWKQVERVLQREQVEYEVHILKSAKETTEFVRKLTEKRECDVPEKEKLKDKKECHIVVLGGDGTLNTVLNGICDFEHTILSCIRTGSGNDFARNMGVKKDARQAIAHLLYSPEKVKLDYGVAYYESESICDTHRFIISSGVGYDADICEEVHRSKLKRILNRVGLGKLVYLVIGIKQIFVRKNSGAIIYMDNSETGRIKKLFFAVGMIHEKEGGGVPFCPLANPTDGLLDVCLVKEMPKWKLLLAIIMVYGKKHVRFKNILVRRCKRLEIVPDKPQWFHMDGETSHRIKRITMECESGFYFCK